MTNWQKKCLTAIMTSPEAYKMFYKTQKNKAYLAQFIGKYFRIAKEKEFVFKISKNSKEFLKILQDCLSDNEGILPDIEHLNIIININIFVKLLENKREEFLDGRNIHNNLFVMCSNNNEFIRIRESSINYTAMIDDLREIKRRSNTFIITRLKRIHGSHASDYTKTLLYSLFEDYFKETDRRFISKKKIMNIGLEFEYDRSITDKDVQSKSISRMTDILGSNKVKENNIISFSQGFDGDSDDWYFNKGKDKLTTLSGCDPQTYSRRSHEDRIRLNGFKGLQSLYKYIVWLNDHGKIPADDSTIHIHIDCVYDNYFDSDNLRTHKWNNHILDNVKKYLNCKKPSILLFTADRNSKILETDYPFKKRKDRKNEYAHSLITKNTLGTFEFREFPGTFEYKYIVAYILVSSYITNCIKKNKRIEDKEIKLIHDALLCVV